MTNKTNLHLYEKPINVWIVVENWHSMARAISVFMSYAKDVVLVSIMTKSLVTNTTYWGSFDSWIPTLWECHNGKEYIQ